MRFLDIGTALQGLTQGYQQSQQQGLQQAIQRLALQQAQQQRDEKGLAGEGLLAGALDNQKPLTNFNPGQGLPQPPPTPAHAAAAPPPAQVADDSGVSLIPGAPISAVPSATATGSGNQAPVPLLPATGATIAPGDPITQEVLPPASSASPAAPSSPDPSSSAGSTSATAGSPPTIDLSRFFHPPEAGHIMRTIMALRPGVDPATAMVATEELYKMATTGTQLERAETASLLKYVFPTANFSMGEAGRNTRQDKSIEAAGTRQDKSITAADARAARRLTAQQYQSALRRADGQQKTQLSEMHRQIGDLDRRINQVMNVNTADPQLKPLVDQRNALAERERKMGEKLLGDAPVQ